MNIAYDTIIVGAGIAGACAALQLSRRGRVLVLEAGEPASGASGAAAGLINPLMGRRACPVWRLDDAMPALHELLAVAGASHLFSRTGVVQPANGDEQTLRFIAAAKRYPEHARWFGAAAARDRWPAVSAPVGALYFPGGGSIDMPSLVRAVLAAAARNGAEVRTGHRVTGWDEEDDAAIVTLEGAASISAARIVLAPGAGYAVHPELARLRLHGVKGQLVRVRRTILDELPALAGRGYIVPEEDSFLLGSSFQHRFTHLRPEPEQTRAIVARAAAMLPALRGAEVIEELAGVRVTVPGIRLPMIGLLPGRRRIWIFSGLGSKGLILAPLIARELQAYLEDPDSIPEEVRVRIVT